MSKDKALKITSLSDLEKYSQGCVVEFPPFAEDQPFVARIKRPSMLVLLKQKKIPNELLGTAGSLFTNKGINTEDESSMEKLYGVLDVIAEACFIEPSWEELKEAGITLTDDQYMFVFNYSQQGVKALNSFRE